MRSYAGVDWVSEKHDVLIEDETGEELFAGSFAHDEAGLRSLCRTLVRAEVELVAIERPDGLLVERLLDAGLRLLAHASQSRRGGAPAVSRLGRQVRSLWRVRDLRAGAHRSSSLPGTRARQRPDQGAAGNDPRARGSRADTHGANQPVTRRARALLAGTDRPVQGSRQPDLARVPEALSQPQGRQIACREAHADVPGRPALQRRQARRRAGGQAPSRARGPRRRA